MRQLLTLLLATICSLSASALEIHNLRTQGYRNPVGLDITSPTFSWVLESNERATMQTSYAIRVASDPQMNDIIWQSGNVESDQSVNVPASGLTLKARTRYYWQVTISDNHGQTAQSRETALFETGLLSTSAWGATKWIKATTSPQGTAGESPAQIKNYQIEVKFQIENVAAGIIFAARDHSNYYMWQISTLGGQPRFRPHIWQNGNATCIETKAISGISLKNGEEHTLRITVSNGRQARTYIDNRLIDTRTGNFAYGDFGFREDQDGTPERAYFDDFRVTSGEEELISEDFETETPIFSGGKVTEGRYYVAGPGGYCWIIPAPGNVKYDVETDLTLVNHNASVCFSATSSNTYMMWAVNTFEVSNPVLRRHVYVNGSLTYSDTPLPFSKSDLLGRARHLRIECRAPFVRTYIDERLVDTYTDTDGLLSIGDIGLRVSATGNERERAYFDNIRVTLFDRQDGEGRLVLSEDFEGNSCIFNNADVRSYAGSRQIYMEAVTGSAKRLMQDEGSIMPGVPVFRKTFTLKQGILRARLYASGLGIYNNYINGQRVGQTDTDGSVWYDELKPGSTDYSKTVFYTTHDVTSLLREGPNVLGAEVSSGWWNGGIAHGQWGNKECAVRALLIVTYSDGSEEQIPTDTSWLSNTSGPLRRGDIYNGEDYDARIGTEWSTTQYDDSDWFATAVSSDFTGTLRAFEGPAVRAVPALIRKPREVYIYQGTKNTGTTYGMLNEVERLDGQTTVSLRAGQTAIYDLGQNAAGWVTFTALGASGTRLHFRFSEMRNQTGDAARGDDGPGGSLYLINLRTAEASLHYTMSGAPKGETFHPTSTYFGFRYVQVTASADVEIQSLVGQTLTSFMDERSSLTTSHEAVNQLISNIIWGQRSNFISVPTDCPQRDERLGWTADTQIYSMAALYNADARNFYRKWMRDMRDSQRADGAYPHVAPYSWGVGYGASVWADAGIVLPYNVYLMTADKEILRENISSMERYMNYLSTQTEGGYKYNGGLTTYGDWVSFVHTDPRYISVCYYAYDALLMSRICQALSDSDNDSYAQKARQYQTLYRDICTEWQGRYLGARGVPTIDTQCAYLLPLRFGMLPDQTSRTLTVQALRRNIADNAYTLNTGFTGTGILNQTLSQVGLSDEAYTLLLQRNCPSWLYSVDQGATTVWERWNSYTREGGFHPDISMNSFNHYAYGAVAEWMYRQMAGIAPDDSCPGFRHVLLQPDPDRRTVLRYGQQRITQVDASVWSPYGTIRAAWQTDEGGQLTYRVTVPANTSATLFMPCRPEWEVTESGRPAAESEGVEPVGNEDGHAVFRLGSGSYVFSTRPATGITAPSDPSAQIDHQPIYDLLGRRWERPTGRRIFVTNGRKLATSGQ